MAEISSVLGSIWAWRKHSKCKVVSSEPPVQNMTCLIQRNGRQGFAALLQNIKVADFLAVLGLLSIERNPVAVPPPDHRAQDLCIQRSPAVPSP